MTLVTEDGTGKANAESYGTVAGYKSYHSKLRNLAALNVSDDDTIEALLREATDFMVGSYRQFWKGYRKSTTQRLDFPRLYVELDDVLGAYATNWLADNVVPEQVVNACYDLAFIAITDDLAPNIQPLIKREKIDVIEVEYDNYSSPVTIWTGVIAKLSPFFAGAGMRATLVRT